MAKACRQTIAVRPIDASNINILNIIIPNYNSPNSIQDKIKQPNKTTTKRTFRIGAGFCSLFAGSAIFNQSQFHL